MTDQQKRFADRYFETLNGSESAIYAGYSENSSRQIAYELLQKPEIEEYIQSLRDTLAERTGVSQERVLTEIARLAFSDIRKYYDENGNLKLPKDLDDDAAAALSGIDIDEIIAGDMVIGQTKKIKVYDKGANLEKLMKYLGMYGKDNAQSAPVINNNITREEIKSIAKDLEDSV